MGLSCPCSLEAFLAGCVRTRRVFNCMNAAAPFVTTRGMSVHANVPTAHTCTSPLHTQAHHAVRPSQPRPCRCRYAVVSTQPGSIAAATQRSLPHGAAAVAFVAEVGFRGVPPRSTLQGYLSASEQSSMRAGIEDPNYVGSTDTCMEYWLCAVTFTPFALVVCVGESRAALRQHASHPDRWTHHHHHRQPNSRRRVSPSTPGPCRPQLSAFPSTRSRLTQCPSTRSRLTQCLSTRSRLTQCPSTRSRLTRCHRRRS